MTQINIIGRKKGRTSLHQGPPTLDAGRAKGVSGKQTKDVKDYSWCKKRCTGKVQWVRHKSEGNGNCTSTSYSSEVIIKSSREGDSNKKLTLTKDFKAEPLDIKYQSYFQAFLSHFKLNAQGNEQARDMGPDTTTT